MEQLEKNNKSVYKIFIKYIIQGIAISIAAFYIPTLFKTSLRKPTFQEIGLIGFTAAFTMYILDYFSSESAFGANLGIGFTIGRNLTLL